MLDYAYKNIGDLSGGQQQRVFISRALVSEPDLLILDEPTVGIDFKNVERFYELLHKLNTEQNITMLLVTHDTGAMTNYATDIVCLNQTLHFHGRRSEEHTSELQSRGHLVCRLLPETKKISHNFNTILT